jgi:hypothetical protein
MEQSPCWEFAIFTWHGNGPKDFRSVTFSHRERESIGANGYTSTLSWLGDEGFELVSHQLVPLEHEVLKTNFGQYKGYPTMGEVFTFKRMLPPRPQARSILEGFPKYTGGPTL